MNAQRPQTTHIAVVLKRMSDYLDGLAEEVHSIEHAIGGEFGGTAPQEAPAIIRLQRLDFLRQSLEDLAQLSLGLSEETTDEIDVNLAEKLRLDSCRAILIKPPHGGSVRQGGSIPLGDVDIF